jgi:hypothetical protein
VRYVPTLQFRSTVLPLAVAVVAVAACSGDDAGREIGRNGGLRVAVTGESEPTGPWR